MAMQMLPCTRHQLAMRPACKPAPSTAHCSRHMALIATKHSGGGAGPPAAHADADAASRPTSCTKMQALELVSASKSPCCSPPALPTRPLQHDRLAEKCCRQPRVAAHDGECLAFSRPGGRHEVRRHRLRRRYRGPLSRRATSPRAGQVASAIISEKGYYYFGDHSRFTLRSLDERKRNVVAGARSPK
jgi:hypothetical protein